MYLYTYIIEQKEWEWGNREKYYIENKLMYNMLTRFEIKLRFRLNRVSCVRCYISKMYVQSNQTDIFASNVSTIVSAVITVFGEKNEPNSAPPT